MDKAGVSDRTPRYLFRKHHLNNDTNFVFTGVDTPREDLTQEEEELLLDLLKERQIDISLYSEEQKRDLLRRWNNDILALNESDQPFAAITMDQALLARAAAETVFVQKFDLENWDDDYVKLLRTALQTSEKGKEVSTRDFLMSDLIYVGKIAKKGSPILAYTDGRIAEELLVLKYSRKAVNAIMRSPELMAKGGIEEQIRLKNLELHQLEKDEAIVNSLAKTSISSTEKEKKKKSDKKRRTKEEKKEYALKKKEREAARAAKKQ